MEVKAEFDLLRFAYADPPYLGCCSLYDHYHDDEYGCWDKPEAHQYLIGSLTEFDGWALSCSTPSLATLLPMCPPDTRVGAWVKPWAVFKPNVNPAYAWEPVLFRSGRKRDRTEPTVRDWVSANITLRKGLVGAKPPAFCQWILDLLGYEEGDDLIDLFPGTGVMGKVAGISPIQEGLFAHVEI